MTAKEVKDQDAAESIEREREEAITDETIKWLEAKVRAKKYKAKPNSRHAVIGDR